MPANFDFLKDQPEYALFANACIEAERVLATSPAMSAVGCRKALELAVKWVYSADNTISMPYKDNLQALIHEPSFRFAMDSQTWNKLRYIINLGNLAVHTDKAVSRNEAVLSLANLFEFIQWIDYCYGQNYEERVFDESKIPSEQISIDVKKIKETESLLEQKEAEIQALLAKIEAMSERLTAEKGQHKEERHFTVQDITEFETRKRYIDLELKLLGWEFGEDVLEEVELFGMPNPREKGYADYVLYGKDGLPLAVIEAKRASKDPKIGAQQAKLYADCLEKMTGRRPIMFITNGFETYIWDDLTSPQRRVSGIFAKEDLQKLINRRTERKPLTEIPIDDKITNRYYQKEAIRAVCEAIEQGQRKALLVMATGTGKTRTACSLVDVLSRGGYITNVLFLADRTALVSQAKDAFKTHLPDMSLCNLLDNKEDRNARIVFSTYPTMLNAIDSTKTEDGQRLFTPAHFDLIIIDEAHRSIFKKYRAIFEYFDAILVGLTATPKTDVDRNTYEFFEMEKGVPTFAYDYETAVHKDHVLVPYYNIEVSTKFLQEGITYDDLSEEDKARYEEDFVDEDGNIPESIPPAEINKFIFNQNTVDMVLQDLMTKGIKVAGGDRLGKTIIFAQNKRHADYIVERFNKLYPQYKGGFARRVVCDDAYAQTIIQDFKVPDKEPHIAVSVDMLETGIDVPEVVNLVFFKYVRSKTKFWQMIGRGTRLCPNLFGEGQHKTHFLIFDYLGNPLVYMEEADEHAKSFDNFMYSLILAQMEAKKAQLKRSRKQLEKTCLELAKRTTIPQIREKIALINDIGTEDFWNSAGILDFEKVRLELRNLIKFIMDEGGSKPVIYTNLKDEVLHIKEGQELDPAYDFEDYRQKVNKYIENNRDHVAIYKLRHNIPLTAVDYQTLERIFTGELGTAEDYKREFQDTPFGLLVRRIAKMDYQAACEAFSEFINDQSLSQAQIVFVKKVIDYIVQNGYIDSPADLMKPPFDKPQSLIKLFDTARQKKLINVVNSIKENAVKIIG